MLQVKVDARKEFLEEEKTCIERESHNYYASFALRAYFTVLGILERKNIGPDLTILDI